MDGTALPYGLRDVRLIPIDSAGVEGTAVDLPVAQKFTFSEAEDYEELRGDDRVVALVGKGPVVDWGLDAGGITLEAWQVITGGTITNSGATPNQKKEFKKLVTDRRPYFKVIGQSIADGGGDTWCELYYCKSDGSIEGEWSDGVFFVTSASGKAIANAAGELYKITWNETPVSIPLGAMNEIQAVTVDATGGTFTLTYSAQTTSALAYNITAANLELALEALSNIGVGEATVTGPTGGPWQVEFSGTLGGTNLTKMTANGGSLTGGGGVAVTTIRNGG